MKLEKLELNDVSCNCTSLCVHVNTGSRMFASSSFKEMYAAKHLGNRKRGGGSTNHIRSLLSPLIFLATPPRLLLKNNNILISNVINNEYSICNACQEKQKQLFL